MAKPTQLIEFETMRLGQYKLPGLPRSHHPGGLDRSAYVLLSRLELAGPMSIGELGEAFGLDVSTLNRQTAAMTRAGLVERIPDPEGGIARKFQITAEGGRRLREERAVNVRGLDRILAEWSPADAEAFATYLRRFNTDIERVTGRPWPECRQDPTPR